MSQPVSNAVPATHSFKDLPEAVQGYLRDEANLSTARHVLEDARSDALTRLEELRNSRPKIAVLMTKKQKEDFANGTAAIQQQIGAIDAMLARVSVARDRIQGPLRAMLLQHMEQADPLYKQGLRASRYHEHWRRGHSLVDDRLQGFLRDLKVARTALANGVAQGAMAHTEETNWSISTLHGASAALDLEIDRLNHWAAEHAKCVEGTHFGRVRLPLLEHWSCVARTEMLARTTPAAALPTVEAIYTEFVEYRQPSLKTLIGMFQAAADEHSQIAEGRLRQRWSQYLNYAECHLVTDAELEPTLAAIEQRLSSAERARLAAQLPFDPFVTER
ncbi:MAG: hypothetical protein QM790_18485 [Nibricoccus sp.]